MRNTIFQPSPATYEIGDRHSLLRGRGQPVLYVFDLLRLDGKDLTFISRFMAQGLGGAARWQSRGYHCWRASVPVLYTGPTPNLDGLDQVNSSLPLSLRGSGLSMVAVTVDGQASNTVMIDIQTNVGLRAATRSRDSGCLRPRTIR